MHATLPLLQQSDFPPISRARLETLQVNLGYRCNQQCVHCHVNAGPKRTETMDRPNIDLVLEFLRTQGIRRLDLTGGAPELNPHFRYLVTEARKLGTHVIDRCNLTILSEPGQEDLAEFLAEQRVEVVASLPCYLEDNVNQQRGKGVYGRSIEGLKHLNALGYGQPGSELTLTLVYNPQGAQLPPPQQALESDYRCHLGEHFGIVFSQLFTITNMPIKRFGSMLISKGEFDGYMQLLKDSYQPQNLADLMCRSLISVSWDGRVFDCDFNQMLNLPLTVDGRGAHLTDLLNEDIEGLPIQVLDHCYGCTAGQGSSCGGALSES